MDTQDRSTPKALRGATLQESLLADGKTVKIQLTKGLATIVGVLDFHIVSSKKWYALKGHSDLKFYAASGTGESRVLMHELIKGKKGIDHKNGDSLDNQHDNLRFADQSQNTANACLRRDSTSGLKGVTFRKRTGRWIAQIGVRYSKIHLGVFDDPKSAALAYDKAARYHFGEFARTNFPQQEESCQIKLS